MELTVNVSISYSRYSTSLFAVSFPICRWYILLVSFVVFPLTLDLSLGCQFIIIGSVTDDQGRQENQALGLFNSAVYDETDGSFLGCVDFSITLKEQTNDAGFRLSRFAGGFMLTFTIMATLLCICVQCFSKSGKSWLWNAMRFSYTGACLCQGFMYAIFSSDICTSFEGEDSQCWLGRNGVAGVFNFALLLGMVVATFYSFPPRHPVFQCWGSDLDRSAEEGSTEEEDEELQKQKGKEVDTSANESMNESVSLFGNSRASRSVKSTRSVKSNHSTKSSKSRLAADETKLSVKESRTDDDDKYSAAESGSLREDRMVRSIEPAVNGEEAVQAGTTTGSLAGSIGSMASRMWKSDKKTDLASKSQGSDNQSAGSSFKGVSKRISKIETAIGRVDHAKTVVPSDVQPSPVMSSVNLILADPAARAKSYPIDHRIEIVDEYPAKAGEGLNAPHSSDGPDVVRVRTEYYDQGSRTTKEVTHHDGSRTVVTIIDSKASEVTGDSDSISTKNTNGTSQRQRSNAEVPKSSGASVHSVDSRGVSKSGSTSRQESIEKVDSKEKSQEASSIKSEKPIEQSASRQSVSKNALTLESRGDLKIVECSNEIKEEIRVKSGLTTTNAGSRTSSTTDSKKNRSSASKSSRRSSSRQA
jgi:hypothetical protein